MPLESQDLSEFEESTSYRLVETSLLAHLGNPRMAPDEWRRVVGNHGAISLYVPCELGALLRLFRLFTNNLKDRNGGVNYYSFHYSEYRKYYIILKYLFNEILRRIKSRLRYFLLTYCLVTPISLLLYNCD